MFCGFNVSCIGDELNHSFILSKYKDSPSDEALLLSYKKLKIKKPVEFSFLQRGSDERQFNSPGVDLKITSVFRTKYGEYKEYHTSLDNFDLVTKKGVRGGFNVVKKAIEIIQSKKYPKVSVLVSNKTIRKNIYTNKTLLQQTSIEDIKKYLIKRGFIKVGSIAPNNVLRKMYESVMTICGDVYNHNSNNLLYNYFNYNEE